MVDNVTASYGTAAYCKFRLGESLDGYLYEDYYIVTDIHIFAFIKIKCFLFKNLFYLI